MSVESGSQQWRKLIVTTGMVIALLIASAIPAVAQDPAAGQPALISQSTDLVDPVVESSVESLGTESTAGDLPATGTPAAESTSETVAEPVSPSEEPAATALPAPGSDLSEQPTSPAEPSSQQSTSPAEPSSELPIASDELESEHGDDHATATDQVGADAPVDNPPAAAGEQITQSSMELSPSSMVFTASEGQECSATQVLSALSGGIDTLDWQLSSSEPWIVASRTSGSTPDQVTLTADCDSLTAGVHTATVTATEAVGQSQAQTQVIVVVNEDLPVSLSTWKDGHRGAFSSSTDDGRSSGFGELVASGYQGTFVMNGDTPPADFSQMYQAGMELGPHLVSHPCWALDEATLRAEIEDNIDGVIAAGPSADEVISLVWPCGYTDPARQAVATEYVLSARGYNINELEDPTPSNFMNLKSFNSHEHAPIPPADLKTIADDAETEGKWANLVLHDYTNDDGAIAYATTKDLWTAPIGTVIKYILQRDRTVISDYSVSAMGIEFDIHRLPLPASPQRDFELAVNAQDTVTFLTEIDPSKFVSSVTVGGMSVPFEVMTEGQTKVVLFSALVSTTSSTVRLSLSDAEPSILHLTTHNLTQLVESGSSPDDLSFGVSNGGGGELVWSASSSVPWLSVSPGSVVGAGSVSVGVDAQGLSLGVHVGEVTVSAPGAVGGSQVVSVSVRVVAAGEELFEFSYPDRASLVGAGWDFLARTAVGGVRNTEQAGGAGVSFDSSGLRVSADPGDLWEGLNSTRNTLFRDLPSTWTSVQASLNFAPTVSGQQAGIVVYGDDDNYVQVTRVFNSWVGGQTVAFVSESGGVAVGDQRVATVATSFVLRLERDVLGGTISGSVSVDGGVSWQSVGSVAASVGLPRVGVVVSGPSGGSVNATIREMSVISDVEGH